MYSFKLVEAPGECEAGCGTTITNRVAGHYYRQPMCDECFSAAAPKLVRILRALQPDTCIQFLAHEQRDDDSETGAETEVHVAVTCANCGDRFSGRLVGYHKGDPLCVGCFGEHATELAALLFLVEAAAEAAAGGFAQTLLDLVVSYFKVLHRRDAKQKRNRK